MKWERIAVVVTGLTLLGLVSCKDEGDKDGTRWRTATLIENNMGDATAPQIAVDGNGNALAVWIQGVGPDFEILANRYTPGSGWGTAMSISPPLLLLAQNPQIAVDRDGNALAVWAQGLSIWANRYTPGGGWGVAQLIENGAGTASDPQIAVDGNGNALAVWQQSDGTRTNIWANRYTPGSGWGTAELIENNDIGDATAPQIAVDPTGNALAVWIQGMGLDFEILANRYTPGSGWGTAMSISLPLPEGGAQNPQIAVDPNGNALAVWAQGLSIWANRYTPGGGWGVAQLIENGAGTASDPQIAFDPDGNALAVWQQSDGTRYNIWANRYTRGGGWGTATLIENNDMGDATAPQIAVDGNGNAVAVWQQSDGTRTNIWANRYTRGGGWGTATLIENNDMGDATAPQIAVDRNGNALAVWAQYDGARYNIWANRYE